MVAASLPQPPTILSTILAAGVNDFTNDAPTMVAARINDFNNDACRSFQRGSAAKKPQLPMILPTIVGASVNDPSTTTGAGLPQSCRVNSTNRL